MMQAGSEAATTAGQQVGAALGQRVAGANDYKTSITGGLQTHFRGDAVRRRCWMN